MLIGEDMQTSTNSNEAPSASAAGVSGESQSAIVQSAKQAIMAALKTGAVTVVRVRYEGSGDSGQVEEIDARDEHGEVAIPEITVSCVQWHTVWSRERGEHAEEGVVDSPLSEFIEYFVNMLVRQLHPGWEINEGSFGAVTFDVADNKVTVEHTTISSNDETTHC